MEKTIIIAAIAVSFVVGIIISPNMATAHLDLCAQPSVNSEKSVWHALCDLQTQIQNIPRGYLGIGNIIIKNIEDSNCETPCSEWNPPSRVGIITDTDVKPTSFIAIMTQNSDGGDCTVFRGTFDGQKLDDNQFGVDCSDNREDGSGLKYLIVNPSQ
jgi:hypothetical protein